MVAHVVVFSGHMTDAPDRPERRFPESAAAYVGDRIRELLRTEREGLVTFSSAARGGDLLFLEAVLEIPHARATVVLPFPAEAFLATSVGQGWDPRFWRCVHDARVQLLPPMHAASVARGPNRDAAFEECNARIVELADAEVARAGGSEPLLITVHADENKPPSRGGAGHMIERWAHHTRRENVDPRDAHA